MSHWKRYKKCTLKFHDQYKNDHVMCEKLLLEFIDTNKSIFTDYIYKPDFGDIRVGFHYNFYLKCIDWQRLRKNYQGTDRVDTRMFFWIDDLESIYDTSDWISYMYMRKICNYDPQLRRLASANTLLFD